MAKRKKKVELLNQGGQVVQYLDDGGDVWGGGGEDSFPIDSGGLSLSGGGASMDGGLPNFGTDPLGIFGNSTSTQSGQGTWGTQTFMDMQTGQVVSGEQAYAMDPNGFQNSMAALSAEVNAASPNGAPSWLQNFMSTIGGDSQGAGAAAGAVGGLSSLQRLLALGLMGGSALGGAAALGKTLSVGTPHVPTAPGLSGTQQGLLTGQQNALDQYAALLNQQVQANQATMPGNLARAGFMPNAQGGMTDIYGSGIQNATLGNLGLVGQYQQQAANTLTGDLEKINPALTQYLNDRQTLSDAAARQQFGPGYQASTPYQWQQYYQNMAKTNALTSNQLQYLNNYQNLANAAFTGAQVSPGTAQTSLQAGQQIGAGLGNLSAGYNNPLQSLQSQQYLGYQGQLNQYNANAAHNAAQGQALGQFAGGLGQLGLGLSNSGALGSLMKGLG